MILAREFLSKYEEYKLIVVLYSQLSPVFFRFIRKYIYSLLQLASHPTSTSIEIFLQNIYPIFQKTLYGRVAYSVKQQKHYMAWGLQNRVSL